MSYSFYLDTPGPLTYEMVLDGLNVPDLVCEEADEGRYDDPIALSGNWRPKFYHHFYRDGISTRSVEVGLEEGTFSVRVMSCSCPEDYQLALDMICNLARKTGGTISSEEGVEFSCGTREEQYGHAWIDDHVQSICTMTLNMALDPQYKGEVMTMHGAVRPFHLGSRLAQQLVAEGDARAITRSLIERIRAVQYIDRDEEEGPYAANPMSVTFRNGKEATLTAFGPGVYYLLPDVEYLALIAEPPIYVRYDALPTLVGERLQYLDERHALVEPIPDDEWERFLARARGHAVDPEAGSNGGTGRKWWRFWKR